MYFFTGGGGGGGEVLGPAIKPQINTLSNFNVLMKFNVCITKF